MTTTTEALTTVKETADAVKTAAEPFQALTDKVAEYATKLEQVIAANSGTAWDMLMWIIRIDNASSVLLGFLLLGLAGLFAFACKKLLELGEEEVQKVERRRGDEGVGFTVMGTISGFMSVALCTVSATFIFSLWTWVGVFYPELKLAKDLLDKVL